MRSLSAEANHFSFTKPSSCLLLRCNYLLEAASLRRNRNPNGNSQAQMNARPRAESWPRGPQNA